MGIEEHKMHAQKTVNCAVITVSSTRTKENDISGKTIIGLLEGNGHTVLYYDVIKDDISLISNSLEHTLKEEGVQAVILNGGTGIGKKDVTVEAVEPFLEKELVGFGELFRYESYKEVGSPAILSRALAGVGEGKIIICLPGSTNACTLAMEKLILPELGHMVYEVGR
ncbi:MAG: MogA/MoaB family molybdenum cofactor biosynthesis protein [Methanomassiliicoccales archaeon]|nr:MAG: MogA/MoaB family molybdenum cofactor biosynthesis protein [Methanomassiliicoccales archaeon]